MPETSATLADVVAAAVLTVPGVVSLHTGAFGEIATYLPGRRVAGVRLLETQAEVHVVLQARADLRRVADRIHDRVTEIVGRPVQVFIEDLADPAES